MEEYEQLGVKWKPWSNENINCKNNMNVTFRVTNIVYLSGILRYKTKDYNLMNMSVHCPIMLNKINLSVN